MKTCVGTFCKEGEAKFCHNCRERWLEDELKAHARQILTEVEEMCFPEIDFFRQEYLTESQDKDFQKWFASFERNWHALKKRHGVG